LVVSSNPKGDSGRVAASTLDYEALATSAFETALATRAGALPSPAPSELRATLDGADSAAVAPGAGEPANPWVNEIPEAACIQTDLPQTGRVVEVVDGRTIKVLLDGDGRVFSVRYIGLGSLQGSTSQLPLSNSALTNAQLTFHKQATLVRDISDADSSGSLLRYVMVDRVFINYALIAAGYAPAESVAPDTACTSAFDAAQRLARAASLGLWAAPTP
jgi:endonuclease YncB( thermonuclease family)